MIPNKKSASHFSINLVVFYLTQHFISSDNLLKAQLNNSNILNDLRTWEETGSSGLAEEGIMIGVDRRCQAMGQIRCVMVHNRSAIWGGVYLRLCSCDAAAHMGRSAAMPWVDQRQCKAVVPKPFLGHGFTLLRNSSYSNHQEVC